MGIKKMPELITQQMNGSDITHVSAVNFSQMHIINVKVVQSPWCTRSSDLITTHNHNSPIPSLCGALLFFLFFFWRLALSFLEAAFFMI